MAGTLLPQKLLPTNLREEYWLLSEEYRKPLSPQLGRLAKLERERSNQTFESDDWDIRLGGVTKAQKKLAKSRNWDSIVDIDRSAEQGRPFEKFHVAICSRENWNFNDTLKEPFKPEHVADVEPKYFLFVDEFSSYVWVLYSKKPRRQVISQFFKKLRRYTEFHMQQIYDESGALIYDRENGWDKDAEELVANINGMSPLFHSLHSTLLSRVENLETSSGLTRVFWKHTLYHALTIHNALVHKHPEGHRVVPYLWMSNEVIGVEAAITNLNRFYDIAGTYGCSVSLPKRVRDMADEEEFNQVLGDFGEPALYLGVPSLDHGRSFYMTLRDFKLRDHGERVHLPAPTWFGGMVAAAYAIPKSIPDNTEMAELFRGMFIAMGANREELGKMRFAENEAQQALRKQRQAEQRERKKATQLAKSKAEQEQAQAQEKVTEQLQKMKISEETAKPKPKPKANKAKKAKAKAMTTTTATANTETQAETVQTPQQSQQPQQKKKAKKAKKQPLSKEEEDLRNPKEFELHNMEAYDVWTLVDRPHHTPVAENYWSSVDERDADGYVIGKKPVIKITTKTIPETSRTSTASPKATAAFDVPLLLALASIRGHTVYKYEVPSAYFRAPIDAEIFTEQPQGFDDGSGRVYKLNKAMYGVPQAERLWYKKLVALMGPKYRPMTSQSSDKSGALFRHGKCSYVCVFSNTMLVSFNTEKRALDFQRKLSDGLPLMSEPARSFLTLTIAKSGNNYVAYPKRSIDALLEDFDLEPSSVSDTPVVRYLSTESRLNAGTAFQPDDLHFKKFQRAMGYLSGPIRPHRPDLAYAISLLAPFTSKPNTFAFGALSQLLSYLNRTRDLGSKFEDFNKPELRDVEPELHGEVAYHEETSRLGFALFLRGHLVSWDNLSVSMPEDIQVRCDMLREVVERGTHIMELMGESCYPWLKHNVAGLKRYVGMPKFIKPLLSLVSFDMEYSANVDLAKMLILPEKNTEKARKEPVQTPQEQTWNPPLIRGKKKGDTDLFKWDR